MKSKDKKKFIIGLIVLIFLFSICGYILYTKKAGDFKVSAGTDNVLLVKNGIVYNYNYSFKEDDVKNDDNYDTKVNIEKPTKVEGLNGIVTNIYAGFSGNSLILSSGQLYSYNATYPSVAAKLVPTGNGFENKSVTAASISSIDIDYSPTYYAIEKGVLYSWGGNDMGQLGNGTDKKSTVPTKVQQNDGFQNKNVKFITSNYGAALVIENGTLYQFGQSTNSLGEAGDVKDIKGDVLDLSQGSALPVNKAPVKVITTTDFHNENVTSASIGGNKTLAVEDGTAFEWGPGLFGDDLGSDAKMQGNIYLPVKLENWQDNKGVQKAITFDSQSVLLKGGKVYTFGTGLLGYKTTGTDDTCYDAADEAKCKSTLNYWSTDDYITVPKLVDNFESFKNGGIKDISVGGGLVLIQTKNKVFYFGDYNQDQIGLFSYSPLELKFP